MEESRVYPGGDIVTGDRDWWEHRDLPFPVIIWPLTDDDTLTSVRGVRIRPPVAHKTLFSFVALSALVLQAFGADEADNANLAFVTEYIRELGAIERIRTAGEQELAAGKEGDAFSNAVHTSNSIQLELRSQIALLKRMSLKPPFNSLTKDIVGFYEQKVTLHQNMIDIASAFIGGPRPDVDYSKLAAKMPKIRANLDYVDRALLEYATPLVFATLIDRRADSKNHVSHLTITRAERAKLLADLASRFGSKLGQRNQNFIVSAASLLKSYLLKDFKSSDDP